jgi:CRISPR system Cascade subunit CasE
MEGKKHPRRMPLVHPRAKEDIETGYLDWLERQADRFGFTVAEDSIVDAPFRLGRKRKLKHDPAEIETIPKARIGHFGVRFDGMLQVDEPDQAMEAVRQGIGPAKAFGFGLLSLAPGS